MTEQARNELRIGSKLRDNDPRIGERILVVVEITEDRVRARDSIGNLFWYKRGRIFTDGKPRRSGLSVVVE